MRYFINEERATNSKKFTAVLDKNLLKVALLSNSNVFLILELDNFTVVSVNNYPENSKEIEKAKKFAKSIIIKKP